MGNDRKGIETYCFALVVVRLGHRFLLVHERKHGQLWYLPAGRLEWGESFLEAARRETLEESGVPIILDGILGVEHSPHPSGTARMRVIFIAHPANDTPPRPDPNEHSLEAGWFSVEEMRSLPLRSPDLSLLFARMDQGMAIYPFSLLRDESRF